MPESIASWASGSPSPWRSSRSRSPPVSPGPVVGAGRRRDLAGVRPQGDRPRPGRSGHERCHGSRRRGRVRERGRLPERRCRLLGRFRRLGLGEPRADGTANAAAEVSSLTLFGGEVRRPRSRAPCRPARTRRRRPATSPARRSAASPFLARPSVIAPNARVALGDWGTAILLAQGSSPEPRLSPRGNVTALDIRIDRRPRWAPAGTQILVGYAEAAVTPAPGRQPPDDDRARRARAVDAPPRAAYCDTAQPSAEAPLPAQNGIPPVIKKPRPGYRCEPRSRM